LARAEGEVRLAEFRLKEAQVDLLAAQRAWMALGPEMERAGKYAINEIRWRESRGAPTDEVEE
jgi:hypothetical protein